MPLSRITSTSFANNFIAQNQGLITGTANGAITVGKGVLINPDGSFTQLTGSNPATGNAWSSTLNFSAFDPAQTVSSGIHSFAVLADPRSTTNGVIFFAGADNQDLKARSIWVDPNNPAIINVGIISAISTSTRTGAGVELVWHAANNLFLGVGFDNNNSLGFRTINVAAGNTVTIGTGTSIATIWDQIFAFSQDNSNVGSFAAFYDSSSARTLVGCYDSGTRFPQVLVANVSGATITTGAKTVIESTAGFLGSGSAQFPKMYGCFDTTTNKSLFLYSASNESRMNLVVATTDATSNIVTLGTPVSLPLCNTMLSFGMTANPNTGKIIIASSNLIYEYSISGTTPNLDATYLIPYNPDKATNGVRKLSYNPVTKNFTTIGMIRASDSQYNYGFVFKKNFSGNNYVQMTETQSLVSSAYLIGHAFAQIGTSNNYVILNSKNTNIGCTVLRAFSIQVNTIPITNDYDTGVFSGFAEDTYTNGQTASVYYANSGALLVSNTLNLTTGSPYIIDWTNTLVDSTSNTTNQYKVVGKALANNKLTIG